MGKTMHSFIQVIACRMFVVALFHKSSLSTTRDYYIGAVEKDWNYAPTGTNNVKGIPLDSDSDGSQFTVSGPHRIGSVYRKVLYREFTDDTFTKEKPHPKYLGLLGPIIKGEVTDTLNIHFKNMANRSFTMHPHGVFYDKGSEGALYDDHTKGDQKGDDHVQPGATRVYKWTIPENHAPTKDDENCLTWAYHSHVKPVNDINTGLIGAILTCKKGTLDESLTRTDVDKEFVLLFAVMDENKSWLLDENIKRFCTDPDGAMRKKTDGGFVKSNKMYSINGRVFGNLEGLDMCLGDKISWHLYGIGTDTDVHSAYFHGQTFVIDKHLRSIATLLPATFVTGTMTAVNPGTWLLNCMVTINYDGGMYALFNVTKCARDFDSPVASGGRTRKYFIAAEEKMWNYGPSGINKMTGEDLLKPGSDASKFFIQSEDRLGGTYKKALYIEYTDDTFNTPKNRTEDELHLGSLGPVIRGEVGDTIEVVFQNKASRNYSIHPVGVLYNKSNEGALYEDGTSEQDKKDDAIPPGGNFTYRWTVPEEMGPRPSDAQCLTRMYLSSVNPTKDRYAGLFGPFLVCKKGSLDSNSKQKNVKEFVLHFVVTLEKNSWYYQDNKQLAHNPSAIDDSDPSYINSNKMHDINGFVYGNQPGLSMCVGDRVSWHIMSGILMHSALFYGNTITYNDRRTNAVGQIQGSFGTVYMTPDNPGEWAIICKTTSHLTLGMETKYTVQENCGKTPPEYTSGGKVRRYYIAAVEETWDYSPSGHDILEGKPLEDSEEARPYTTNGPKRIGHKYKKAMFQEYTDATFATKKERKTDYDKHLGIMGPVIKAEVEDTVEVLFKNMASREYSVHSDGLFYKKRYEGSNYRDGTSAIDTVDNAIAPGKVFKYVWQVPERTGPTEDDDDCVAWAYYSDSASVRDFYTGLVGPLVVCRKGTLNEDNSRRGVDREFYLLFSTFDENRSWYIDDNINDYCSDPGPIDQLKNDAGFKESNQNYAINGFIYGNIPGLKMYSGEKVEWYLMGLGDLTDVHTVHFHGQSFVYKSKTFHREDVYDIFPGIYATVEMVPDSVGDWLLHCHVNNHLTGGMQTLFSVMTPTSKPVESGAWKAKTDWMNLTSLFVVLVLLFAS